MKEKYKAKRNQEKKPKEKPEKKAVNNEDEPVVKSQDEKNIENNENTLKNAAEVAEATGNPYAVAIAKAFKAADKISGGKSTQMLAKGMNKANKIAPGGKQIQNASNKLSESGAGDKIGQAAAMKNNKGASSGGGGANAGKIASSGGSKKSSGGGLKLLIVGVAAFTVVIFMSIITAVASKDDANLDLTNNSSMPENSYAGGDLVQKLNDIGNWYVENVPTYTCHTDGKFYECRTNYDNPFTGRAYGDDCTEFATSYMAYVAGQDISASFSGGMVDPNGAWAQEVEKLNWKAYTSDEIDFLKPGDVLIAHEGSFYCTKGKHAEIYIDENHTFGWGTIKKSYPTNNTISAKEYNGHVHFEDGGHDYITIYRYEGPTTSSER